MSDEWCVITQDFLMELKKSNEFQNFVMRINYCKTIIEKIKYIDYMMNKTKYFTKYDKKIRHSRESKNDEISLTHRRKSKMYKRSLSYRLAIEELNKSLCYATNNSENLAIAYFWRSEIDYDINEYENCLRNIHLAKNCVNCPKGIKKKLIERETNCMKKLNHQKRENVHPSTVDDEPKLSYPPHQKMPFIANCLGVKRHNDNYYLYAKTPLKSGDCVAIEEIFTSVCALSMNYKICSYCLNDDNTNIMIPCDKCTRAMYCNEKCKMEAYNDYHKYECEILDFLQSALVPVTFFLPTRMVLKALSLFENMNELIEFTRLKSSKVNIFATTYDTVPSNASPSDLSDSSVSTCNCIPSVSISNQPPTSNSNCSSINDSASTLTSTFPTSFVSVTNEQNTRYSNLISFTKKDHYKAFYGPSELQKALLNNNQDSIIIALFFINVIKRYMLQTEQLKRVVTTDYQRDNFSALIFHHLLNNINDVDYTFDPNFIGNSALKLALKSSKKPNTEFCMKNKKWMLITTRSIPANSLITSKFICEVPQIREDLDGLEDFQRYFTRLCIEKLIRSMVDE